jgi:hypothetical protein
MTTTEKRCLLVGGVWLTKGRLKLSGRALLAARNELDVELRKNGYLRAAPFEAISVIVRYGSADNLNPEIGEVDQRHSELPVAVTLDARPLSALDLDALTQRFREVLIDVLCDVAANFDLPYQFLDAMRKV